MPAYEFKPENVMNADTIESRLYLFSPCILKILLLDRTTGHNIFWATDSHISHGKEYEANMPLRVELIKNRKESIIRPRALKAKEEQAERTKKKAEVFTPSWLCNVMINHIDEEWFGHKPKFNTETEKSWETIYEPIQFTKEKSWKDYVRNIRLEITCGEAPFLVSRYDTVTGDTIPVKDRIGILDRKLRVISENVENERSWVRWAYTAFKCTYGYEFQGDNLVLARENFLFTFIEHMVDKFGHGPTTGQLKKIAEIISWNLWQMDGLARRVPFRKVNTIQESEDEARLFEFDEEGNSVMNDYSEVTEEEKQEMPYCKIMDWKILEKGNPEPIEFRSLERKE